MSKKPTNQKAVKQPKTVKVSTLVKTGVIVLAIGASFVAGIYTNNHYKENVRNEAAELVTQLKTNQ